MIHPENSSLYPHYSVTSRGDKGHPNRIPNEVIQMEKTRNKHRRTAFALAGLVLVYAPALPAKALNYVGAGPALAAPESMVELRFEGQRLFDAMAEVARRSGVRIMVAPELVDEKVHAAIRHAQWRGAITKLLKGFDHIAIVDREGRFRKIWITGRKADGDMAAGGAADQASSSGRSPGGKRLSGTEPEGAIELPVAIWQPLEQGLEASQDDEGIPWAPVQSDPAFFEAIRVGQPLEILIPQEESPLFAVVGETHSQLNGRIQVWSGPIDGAHETASFTITRGQITTYITVATGMSIYEISVDNATGLGKVVNEVDLTKGTTEKDFVIPEEADVSSGRDGL